MIEQAMLDYGALGLFVIGCIKAGQILNARNEKMEQKYEQLVGNMQEQHKVRETQYRDDSKHFVSVMQQSTSALESIVDRLDNIEKKISKLN